MATDSTPRSPQWVLQICHGYDGPFLDCARQYAALFKGTDVRVCTVYLTGEPSAEVAQQSEADDVIFLSFTGRDLRGLKIDAIRRIRHISQQREYQLCIAHRFKPIYASLLATALPVVAVHHAFGVYQRPMRRWLINRFRSRLLLLGVSDAVRDEIRSHLKRWETTRIETLYNRIDVSALQAVQLPRDAARRALGLPEDRWIVGSVGRLHPDKDQHTLIRGFAAALPALPDGSLLAIMGQGRLEAQLKELARQLGVADSVVFLGQVSEGRKYFRAFDVFALSSDHEPFGMVLLEAMAAGLPVVSCATGGAAEVVSSIGWLFPLRDKEALAERLLEVAALSEENIAELRSTMVAQLAARFSDDAVRPHFFALLPVLGWSPE